jgi:hypothetical protein
MNLLNPIPEEWGKYITQSPVGLEVIPDMLWDTQTYVDNTTTELTFFAAVQAGALSNMTQPGMLPNPQSFLIECVRLYFRTQVFVDDAGAAGAFASIYSDVALILNTSQIRLTIGAKNYGPWRPWLLSTGSYPQGVIAASGAEAANLVHDYAQIGGPLWNLRPNLMIAPLQNFNAVWSWPNAAVNLTANIVLEVLFEGQRARGIQ